MKLQPLLNAGFIASSSLNGKPPPSISTDFADPSILNVGNTWHSFGSSAGGLHVQRAFSNDFNRWTRSGQDALPSLPSWVEAGSDVWGPDVVQRDDGKFVMYFGATLKGSKARTHCVGTALSSAVTGPYTPSSQIFACPGSEGGAIDPDSFRDVDGTRYVTYKVDGNARGNGGICGNTNYPRHSTPLMLQKVASDGITPVGGPVQILDRDDNDGPLIEAPSLTRIGGKYYLFFSSNCYDSPQYDTSFAVSDSIAGPYTKRGPLFLSGRMGGLVAPGGADVSPDGRFMVFHAGDVNSRYMYTARLSFDGREVQACTSSGQCEHAYKHRL